MCVNLLSWHANSGQLHVTIEPGSAALKLRATLHSCYVKRCVAGPRFRPGRAAFKASGPGRAGPRFRPDRSEVSLHTHRSILTCKQDQKTAVTHGPTNS